MALLDQADGRLPFCYITTVGRRTGRLHTIEIWFAADGDTLYVLTFERSDTVRNALVHPDVTIRVGERSYRATARVVRAATDEDRQARRLVVGKYQAPGAHDLESWGETALAVAFDVTTATAGPPGA